MNFALSFWYALSFELIRERRICMRQQLFFLVVVIANDLSSPVLNKIFLVRLQATLRIDSLRSFAICTALQSAFALPTSFAQFTSFY